MMVRTKYSATLYKSVYAPASIRTTYVFKEFKGLSELANSSGNYTSVPAIVSCTNYDYQVIFDCHHVTMSYKALIACIEGCSCKGLFQFSHD